MNLYKILLCGEKFLNQGKEVHFGKVLLISWNHIKKKQHIYFCYINIGSEIARIEFPEWVAENSRLLNQALEIVFSQVNKGFGYPIALSEAHNQAVMKTFLFYVREANGSIWNSKSKNFL